MQRGHASREGLILQAIAVCPTCHGPLAPGAEALVCKQCGGEYRMEDNTLFLWCLVMPGSKTPRIAASTRTTREPTLSRQRIIICRCSGGSSGLICARSGSSVRDAASALTWTFFARQGSKPSGSIAGHG